MKEDSNPIRCHLCGAASFCLVPGYEALLRVTSDCKPWRRGGQLAVCSNCGGVQKRIDRNWHDEVNQIYDAYDMYHQSGGVEQAVFDQNSGGSTSRSSRLIEALCSEVFLSQNGRLLDVGCGNGALLRVFSTVRPHWALYGTELSDKHRETIETIPGVAKQYRCPAREVPGRFDLITMIHVLEHITKPSRLLKTLRAKLTPTGLLVIQVPDHRQNPFDLLIADHCTHFTIESLLTLVSRAGFVPVVVTTKWITKELTVVARPANKPIRPRIDADVNKSVEAITDEIRWLTSAISWACQLIERSDCIGLFGTSIAATWLSGTLEDRVSFYVDEDPSRIGRTYRGRPIVHPDQVPSGADVILLLAPSLAAQVAQRLNGHGVDYGVPPVPPTVYPLPDRRDASVHRKLEYRG